MAWKSLGFHDTNTSSSLAGIIRQEDTVLDKVLDGTGKGAEIADTITWAALWEAVKAEQSDKKPAGKSYEQACEDRFREVIYATQVVDSPLARSQAMRNTSVYSQMLTAFGSEPTLSFNMVRHAVLQYQADVQRLGKEAARSKHRNKLLAVFAAYVGTAALSAVVESFFDAIRDDDDETFLRKFSEAFIGRWEPGKGFWANAGSFAFSNFASNLSPFTKLPIVRDIVSLMEGYDTERTELMGVKSTIKAAQIGLEFFRVKTGKQENYTKATYYGNMTAYGAISVALKALSQGVGIPFYAVTRDVVSAWNVVARTFGWEQIKSYDSESDASKAYRGSDEALDKYTEKTISDKAAKLMAEGASEAEALEEGARFVATQMRALIKDGYITGALTVEEATKQLVDIGGQTEDEAYWKIKEWDSGRKDYSKYDSLEAAIRADSRQSYTSAFHELTAHGVDDKTARTQATKIIHEMYDEGILSDDATIRLLTEYAGKDTDAAERTINSW